MDGASEADELEHLVASWRGVSPATSDRPATGRTARLHTTAEVIFFCFLSGKGGSCKRPTREDFQHWFCLNRDQTPKESNGEGVRVQYHFLFYRTNALNDSSSDITDKTAVEILSTTL